MLIRCVRTALDVNQLCRRTRRGRGISANGRRSVIFRTRPGPVSLLTADSDFPESLGFQNSTIDVFGP